MFVDAVTVFGPRPLILLVIGDYSAFFLELQCKGVVSCWSECDGFGRWAIFVTAAGGMGRLMRFFVLVLLSRNTGITDPTFAAAKDERRECLVTMQIRYNPIDQNLLIPQNPHGQKPP